MLSASPGFRHTERGGCPRRNGPLSLRSFCRPFGAWALSHTCQGRESDRNPWTGTMPARYNSQLSHVALEVSGPVGETHGSQDAAVPISSGDMKTRPESLCLHRVESSSGHPQFLKLSASPPSLLIQLLPLTGCHIQRFAGITRPKAVIHSRRARGPRGLVHAGLQGRGRGASRSLVSRSIRTR